MSLDDLGFRFGEQFVDTQLQSWEDTPLQLLINDWHIEINDFLLMNMITFEGFFEIF